jgi:hypothetical protein
LYEATRKEYERDEARGSTVISAQGSDSGGFR